MNLFDRIFGEKIAKVRITPSVLKIILVFTVLILTANFSTNYLNLEMNRDQLVKLTKDLLVKDLKNIYDFAATQFQIFNQTGKFDEAVFAMETNGVRQFPPPDEAMKSVALGLYPDGSILFQASRFKERPGFSDSESLKRMLESKAKGTMEGILNFRFNGNQYFGIYKWSEEWEAFLIRGEERSEYLRAVDTIFERIIYLILVITVLCTAAGVFALGRILRYIQVMTKGLRKMQMEQRLELIDLKGASNDDITYLGVSFNSLASTIDNLMTIFKKFVTKDIAIQAYREKEIRLEGKPAELAILFTDIKGFTYMTETLGNDIINILNLHYSSAIQHIHQNEGIVGSIIGDALLAVYGTLGTKQNKSIQAIRSAYLIQEVAASIRRDMTARKEEIVRARGALTAAEERVFKAILIEVGVGIDGGTVFYGNIGSYERMTNTVIGDNVNSASRLEGLTRIYKAPVICSEFIKEEAERDTDEYRFLELDQVQVKGKTEGKRIYWPIRKEFIDSEMEKDIAEFEWGLDAYYAGSWRKAEEHFGKSRLPLNALFLERIAGKESPEGWSGIWTMTTK
jgi:class 3 adenylate cyclase